MKKNKLSAYSMTAKKSWYLAHPIKWIEEKMYNRRCARQRVLRGYCDMDWYNFYVWFLNIVPAMFRDLANKGCSYPSTGKYNSKEKWSEWLLSTADKLDKCRDDNEAQNEYAEEFEALLDKYDSIENFPSKGKIIRHKYMQREKEIAEERRQMIIEVFREIGENFYDLWD